MELSWMRKCLCYTQLLTWFHVPWFGVLSKWSSGVAFFNSQWRIAYILCHYFLHLLMNYNSWSSIEIVWKLTMFPSNRNISCLTEPFRILVLIKYLGQGVLVCACDEICKLFVGSILSAVVTLKSIELYTAHKWIERKPAIYFKCSGENKTFLPDVKKADDFYSFKGEESWQVCILVLLPVLDKFLSTIC